MSLKGQPCRQRPATEFLEFLATEFLATECLEFLHLPTSVGCSQGRISAGMLHQECFEPTRLILLAGTASRVERRHGGSLAVISISQQGAGRPEIV